MLLCPDLFRVSLEHNPNVRVIIFTAFDADERILAAVQAGAQGYILKGAPRDQVIFTAFDADERIRWRTGLHSQAVSRRSRWRLIVAASHCLEAAQANEPEYRASR